MENRNKTLSLEYYKRKQYLNKKKFALLFILASSVLFLLTLSIIEGWIVKILISQSFSLSVVTMMLVFTALYLAVYNVVLSRLTLSASYYFYSKNIPIAVIMTLFIILYIIFSICTSNLKNVIPLGVTKLCLISLFFRFWDSQLSEGRMQTGNQMTPQNFIISWRAFFICRWVLVACWLVSSLGFALAIVASHPIIELGGFEGLLLIGTFYFLFRAFVKNPNAHANY